MFEPILPSPIIAICISDFSLCERRVGPFSLGENLIACFPELIL